MGFMQKLRQNMPAVIIFLIVMFVALIIFEWGVQRAGGGGKSMAGAQSIGEVNGVPINAAEYDATVNNAIDAQRKQNPDADVEDQPIRDAVWSQMVDDALIQQAADRLGIRISDEELREVMMYDPPDFLKQQFTDSTGVFNQSLYQSFMSNVSGFLTQQKMPADQIKKYQDQIVKVQELIRKQRLREAVQSVVTSSTVPGPAEAYNMYVQQKSKLNGNLALLDANTIPDAQVMVTDDDAKKYYDAHKSDFLQKASREARYVQFTLTPSSEDSASVQRRLKEVNEALASAKTPAEKDSLFASWVAKFVAGKYNGTKYTPLQEIPAELQARIQGAQSGSILGPVSDVDGTHIYEIVDIKDSGDTYVKAQHVLLKTTPGGNQDSVKALADQIYSRAKSGEDFAKLAQEFSADPGSASRGGDVGYFKKGMMVKPFEEAAFGASVGSVVGPVKSDYGYHIIKVTDRASRSYKLRDLKFVPHVSNPTKNLLRRKAQDFRDQLAKGGSIDSLAKKQGLQVLETGPLQRSQPIAGSMKLTYWAYDANVNDVSEVNDLSGGNLAVAQLTKVNTAGQMDFAAAKELTMTKLRLQKKLDMIKDRATKLRASITNSDSLTKLQQIDPAVQIQKISNLTPTSPFPGVGLDYPLAAAAFAGKPGELTPLIRGDHGYYIVKVDSLAQPSDKDFATDREKFVNQLITQRRSALFEQWLQKERERANIKDLRGGSF